MSDASCSRLLITAPLGEDALISGWRRDEPNEIGSAVHQRMVDTLVSIRRSGHGANAIGRTVVLDVKSRVNLRLARRMSQLVRHADEARDRTRTHL